MSATGLILQHGDCDPPAPPALLAEWAAERGVPLQVHRADHGEPLPEVDGQAFVASLGSPHNPEDGHVATVAAELLADSPVGVQAFAHGPHLAVQFHPESTIEIVRRWARADRERLAALGVDDGEALLEEGRHHADAARAAAYTLFDAFSARAHNHDRGPASGGERPHALADRPAGRLRHPE